MAVDVSSPVAYQPSKWNAVTNLIDSMQARRAKQMEAQGIDEQHNQQLLREMLAKMDYTQRKEFLAANPDLHKLNLPELTMNADDATDAARKRLMVTPDEQLKPHERAEKIMGTTGKDLGQTGHNLFADYAMSGGQGPAMQEGVDIATGRKMDASQAASAEERTRHNVTEEKQTAPERATAAQRNTQQGRAAGALATNREQERDINSPIVQTKIKTAVATRPPAKGEDMSAVLDKSAQDLIQRARALQAQAVSAKTPAMGDAMKQQAQQFISRANVIFDRAAKLRGQGPTATKATTTSTPVAPPTAAPADSATPKVGDRKKFPNGRVGTWDGHGWL